MEEGKSHNGYLTDSRPSSPSSFLPPTLLRPLRRFMSSSRPRVQPINTVIQKPVLRHTHTSPAGFNPVTATGSSSPTHQYQNGFSRSASPSQSHFEDGTVSNSISSLSRSRNSSQMNLSTLVPRQIPISRANSALHVHPGHPFGDE